MEIKFQTYFRGLLLTEGFWRSRSEGQGGSEAGLGWGARAPRLGGSATGLQARGRSRGWPSRPLPRVHALEFGPRGRAAAAWTSFPLLTGFQPEWVVQGTVLDSGYLGPLHEVDSASGERRKKDDPAPALVQPSGWGGGLWGQHLDPASGIPSTWLLEVP